VQLPPFGIKHTTKAQYLTDMRLNLLDDIVSYYAMWLLKKGCAGVAAVRKKRAWQFGFGLTYFYNH
jgi:hypothetical protein